jgi:cytochrome c biogenesis protein ResB
MHFIHELKTILFGWSQMRRSCYVERPAMKNYEEFKGYQYRVEFDEESGQFVNRALAKPQAVKEPILFVPTKPSKAVAVQSKKERRYA